MIEWNQEINNLDLFQEKKNLTVNDQVIEKYSKGLNGRQTF